MRKRRYEQRERAVASARTRAELLKAAGRLVARQGPLGVGAEAVAAEAGASRRTVYNQFGSWQGLLEALFESLWTSGDALQLAAVSTEPEPLDALRASVLATCRMWAADRRLFRRLTSMAGADPDVAKGLTAWERRRAALFQPLVARLQRAKRLQPGLGRKQALREILALTSFSTFDALAPRGHTPEDVAQSMLRLVGAVVRL